MKLPDQDHTRYMTEALALAEVASAQGEVPVGAVVVHDGVVIGRGHNTREVDQDPTAHAEIIAIREAAQHLGSWRLEGCTLYVTLEPCAMCAGACVLARIARCVYGCTDPRAGFLGTLGDLSRQPELNHHFDVVSGVLEMDCRSRLVDFFRALRERKKRDA